MASPEKLWIVPQGDDEYAAQSAVVFFSNAVGSDNRLHTRARPTPASLSSKDAEEREEAVLALGESASADS